MLPRNSHVAILFAISLIAPWKVAHAEDTPDIPQAAIDYATSLEDECQEDRGDTLEGRVAPEELVTSVSDKFLVEGEKTSCGASGPACGTGGCYLGVFGHVGHELFKGQVLAYTFNADKTVLTMPVHKIECGMGAEKCEKQLADNNVRLSRDGGAAYPAAVIEYASSLENECQTTEHAKMNYNPWDMVSFINAYQPVYVVDGAKSTCGMNDPSCGEHGCAVSVFSEYGAAYLEVTGSDPRASKDERRILVSVADSECEEKGTAPCVAEYDLAEYIPSVKRLVDNPLPPIPSYIQPLTDPEFLVGTWLFGHEPRGYVFKKDGSYQHFAIQWNEDGTWVVAKESFEKTGTWEFRSGKLYMDGEETIVYKMKDTHVYFGDVVHDAEFSPFGGSDTPENTIKGGGYARAK